MKLRGGAPELDRIALPFGALSKLRSSTWAPVCKLNCGSLRGRLQKPNRIGGADQKHIQRPLE